MKPVMQNPNLSAMLLLMALSFFSAALSLTLVVIFFATITEHTYELSIAKIMLYMFSPMAALALLFWFLGEKCKLYFVKIRLNVKVAALLIGIASFFAFSGLLFVGVMYLLLPLQNEYIWWLRGIFIIGVIVWGLGNLFKYRRRLIQKDFIHHEFVVMSDRIVMRYPHKTNIDATFNTRSFLGRFFQKLGPYFVMSVPMAFPLQKALSTAGGYEAVALVAFVLAGPLFCGLFFEKLVCGAYLNIYKVSQLERQHGLPVVVDPE